MHVFLREQVVSIRKNMARGVIVYRRTMRGLEMFIRRLFINGILIVVFFTIFALSCSQKDIWSKINEDAPIPAGPILSLTVADSVMINGGVYFNTLSTTPGILNYTMVISNSGSNDLVITSITGVKVSGSGSLNITNPTFPLTVKYNATVSVPCVYTASGNGMCIYKITISSNSASNPSYVYTLRTVAFSNVLYVSPSGDNTTGTTPATAFNTIASAFAASTSGTAILVTQMTETTTSGLVVPANVSLIGGYNSSFTACNPGVYKSCLSGSGMNSPLTLLANVTLYGFTVNGSSAIASFTYGVYSDQSNLNIVNCTITAPDSATANYGIYLFGSSNSFIMNSTIYSSVSSGTDESGIVLDDCGTMIVLGNHIITQPVADATGYRSRGIYDTSENAAHAFYNNTIDVASAEGTTAAQTVGIEMDGSSFAHVIDGNIITVGSSNTVYGMLLSNEAGGMGIKNNVLRLDAAEGNMCAGIWLADTTVNTIGGSSAGGNRIVCGRGSVNTYGVYIDSGSTVSDFSYNYVVPGQGTLAVSAWYGVLAGGSVQYVANNLIVGGESSNSNMLYLNASGNPYVYNNTLIATGSTTQHMLFISTGSIPYVINNIFAGNGSSLLYGMYENGSNPNLFLNNAFINVTTPYRATTGGCDPNDAANTTGGPAVTSSGNKILSYAGFASSTDFHLTAASPVELRQGGATAASLAPAGVTPPSVIPSVDIENTARTASVTASPAPSNANAGGISIGAFECDL
jgi:hypothetical protein